MKISKIKNNQFVKWCVVFLVCYLLASVGVNGVINPYYYVNSGDKEELEIIKGEEYQMIDLTLAGFGEGYLNIKIDDMNTFQQTVNVIANFGTEDPINEKLELFEGINSYKLSDLADNVGNLAISQRELTEIEVVLDSVFWSAQKQVDILKTVEIMASFLSIAVFYMSMMWIKNKYAK